MPTLAIDGNRLEYAWIDPRHGVPRDDAPTLVFLHEGLGSLSMWKEFPAQVATATGCRALAYSRLGYGKSDPLQRPRQVDYMHVEALQVLPQLLRALAIDDPILVGHSDGASIALIYAASAGRSVRGLALLAPHVFVEDLTVASIAQARDAYRTTDLRARLARYHDDPDHSFWSWNDIWLNPNFRHWNIEALLPRIACPIVAIQGEEDEYGTMAQLDSIVLHKPDTEAIKLAGCRHSPHRDREDEAVRAITRLVERVMQKH